MTPLPVRASRPILFAVLTALAAASPSNAADPTLGGTLGMTADKSTVVIQSQATVPVTVDLEMPEGWTAAASGPFHMEPGEVQRVKVTTAGPEGQVLATMRVAQALPGTDTATMVLSLGTPRPPGFPWVTVAFWTIGLLALALIFGRELRRRGRPRLVWT